MFTNKFTRITSVYLHILARKSPSNFENEKHKSAFQNPQLNSGPQVVNLKYITFGKTNLLTKVKHNLQYFVNILQL